MSIRCAGTVLLAHWFPTWGVNYPNWVMVPFNFGNGLFFILDQNRKTGTAKTGQTVALKLMFIVYHLFPFNWMCNRNKWAFCEKIVVRVLYNDPMSGCDFG